MVPNYTGEDTVYIVKGIVNGEEIMHYESSRNDYDLNMHNVMEQLQKSDYHTDFKEDGNTCTVTAVEE